MEEAEKLKKQMIENRKCLSNRKKEQKQQIPKINPYNPQNCVCLLPGYQCSTILILSCLVSLETRNKLKYPEVCQRSGSKTRPLCSKGKWRFLGYTIAGKIPL